MFHRLLIRNLDNTEQQWHRIPYHKTGFQVQYSGLVSRGRCTYRHQYIDNAIVQVNPVFRPAIHMTFANLICHARDHRHLHIYRNLKTQFHTQLSLLEGEEAITAEKTEITTAMFGLLLICAVTLTVAPVHGDDLLAVASANGCGKIVGLIQTAGLADTLKTTQDLTLFAPRDEAVDMVPSAVLNQLQSNITLLQDVLKFHVLGQVTRAADITNDLLVQPLFQGAKMRLNVYENRRVVTAEGALISRTDLDADNGVVHVIDKVIYPLPLYNLPLTMTFDKDLGSLAYMIYQARLTEALSNESDSFTVFAPSNEALNKLPGQVYNDLLMNVTRLKEVLFTHVVKGMVFSAGLQSGEQLTNMQGTQLSVSMADDGVVSIENAHVTVADMPASNAVVHVIDTVLMPK
ncbi:hypothetical protein BaRGS_00018222 [Batillaria attramentaria]|uniref:FAS1 domain-containing protein n=1 Tax=Batillaria attramentaria TaxID=370345 RepID=A0ABD0KTV3_9CAEN